MEQAGRQKRYSNQLIPLVDKRNFDEFDEDELPEDDMKTANDLKEMVEFYETSMSCFSEGELVKGTVVNLSSDYITIDVGFKSEGTIPLSEFPHNGKDLSVGEEVEVLIEQVENNDGEIILSKEKADKIKVWDAIVKAYDESETVEGIVMSRIKGGLRVDIGLKAFLPGSQVDLRPIKNLDKLVGQKLKMKIIKMNKKRGNIILSRRTILEEERVSSRKETLANLEEGKIIDGVVKNITDYGAFIDMGGVDGLLHITDMSWGRISHPSELFALGDNIRVMVLKFEAETGRVSLGYKQITPDPWSNVEDKYPIGTKVRGKVVSVTDYGIFIELEQGIEGLIHISEMSWNKYLKHPSKIVAIGDTVDAQILSLDKDKKKISLSIKQIEPNPWENIEERYPVGMMFEGKVRNLTDFGAFVELEDGIDGLIHTSDMSWTQKVKHPSEVVKKRDIIKAIVLSIDKDHEKISLGIKQLSKDPWEDIGEKFSIGMDITGEVVKVTNFGVFVKIENGIEGLVHISQISSKKVVNPKALIKIGEKVNAKIIKIDEENRKLGLSIRAHKKEIEAKSDESGKTEEQEGENRDSEFSSDVVTTEEPPAEPITEA